MIHRRKHPGASFVPDDSRYDGSFTFQYFPHGQAFQLGGVAVNQSEALVRLGVMPHNNILTNKIMGRIGRRTTELLRAYDDNMPKRLSGKSLHAHSHMICGNWFEQSVVSKLLVFGPNEDVLSKTACAWA
ncbi:MAG: hypothetical protein GY821_10370, partial [Gammaproteobacteria bacterium]|nr:hypothetical protein [Gammaproteobacteria bacterium]